MFNYFFAHCRSWCSLYIIICYTLGVKAGNLFKGIPILFSPNFHVWILHLGILIQLTEFDAD